MRTTFPRIQSECTSSRLYRICKYDTQVRVPARCAVAVDAAKIVVERRPLLGRLAANAKGTSRAAASRGAAGAQQASWQGAAVAAATAAEILAPLLPPVGRGVLASDVLSLPLRDGASSIELGLAGKLLL